MRFRCSHCHAVITEYRPFTLNIKLLYRPQRDPAPGGLIERFFQTCQTQFEAEVRCEDILTLDRLHRFFSAWLDVGYHQRTHSETGQTPRQRYQAGQPFTRQVDLQRLFFSRVPWRSVAGRWP